MVRQRAMTFMEEGLRTLLEDSEESSSNVNKVHKISFFNSNRLLVDGEQCVLTLSVSSGDKEYPSFPSDTVTRMNRIACAMILAGYEIECCQVYSIPRRNAFREQMKKLEFEKINMEDVQRMTWDSLEGEITRYILQKVKGSTEIHQVMGDTWCMRRSTIVRQYHKNYQRETWGKVLQILSHDGMQVHGKVAKATVKERFKNFNAMFDEIHRTQSTWVVSDEQLQSELRVSLSALVIPAYRSFFGRFRQYFDNPKQAEKYIKYQPEDIQTLIDDFFDGNSTSMARRKT
ncbi:hypothetical protein K7X08_026175 [Anisodus acutangulus]|uniref:Exocyst subunit Exo70 family protein n=1 Tax=Anisodus acutangulus TaxID=402998 RepID=A0A9Q1RS49_9SOLA|nr:hypothetical protein K7X08_026175 [Anisodus acutangulus]